MYTTRRAKFETSVDSSRCTLNKTLGQLLISTAQLPVIKCSMAHPIEREEQAYLPDINPLKLEGTYEHTKIRRHRQPTRVCPPALGLAERITPCAKKLICYKKLHKAFNLGQVFWKELNPRNARYTQDQNLLSFRLLSKHTKIKVWFIWEGVFEDGVLRIFGPKREK